jgi:hypothetical protein
LPPLIFAENCKNLKINQKLAIKVYRFKNKGEIAKKGGVSGFDIIM